VTFGAIRGGLPWRISRNPFACSLYVEVRTVPGQSFETIKRELRAVLRRYAEKTGAEEPQLSTYLTDPATVIDEDLPIMDALGRAQGQVMGKRHPSIMRRPGADAVHFTVYDVPCVSFGPGGRQRDDLESRPMHEVGEHVHVDDLMTAAHIYLATALDLCNRSAGDAPAAGRQQTDHGGVKAR
jgi:acetylornithine deacetylase